MSEKKEYLPIEYYRIGMPVRCKNVGIAENGKLDNGYVYGKVGCIDGEGRIHLWEGDLFEIPYTEESWPVEDVSPILRRMGDMTQEEIQTFDELLHEEQIVHYGQGERAVHPEYIHGYMAAINYLREINIDTDGLIDSGHAIDAKTLGNA